MASGDQLTAVPAYHRHDGENESDRYSRLRTRLGWLAAFLLIFFAGVTVHEAGPYHYFGRDWGTPAHRTDYTVYYGAGQAVLHGSDIYAVRSIRGWAYVYPPPFSIAMVPLSLLPLPLSVLFFYSICAGLMVWAVIMAARLAQPSLNTPRTRTAMITVPFLLTFVWFGHGLARGQASVLVAWLVIAAVYWERRGRLASGACCLAGAVLLKVFPLSLLAYYAWRGRWRFVAVTLAAVTVGTLVLPTLVFGWHGNLHYLQEWKQAVVDPATMSESGRSHYDLYDQLLSLGKPRNNALAPVLFRLFGGQETPLISVVIAAALAGLMLLVDRGIKPNAKAQAEPLMVGAVLTWMLLISPVAEDHYYAMMLLPAAFGVAAVLAAVPGSRRAIVGGAGLVTFGVLNFSGVLGHVFEFYGVVCWAALLLWALLLYLAYTSTPAYTATPDDSANPATTGYARGAAAADALAGAG